MKRRREEEEVSEDHGTNETRSPISVGHIPTDLMLEILARLPPKSLMRFQCVSKLWASIIRSRVFVDLFLTRSLTQPRLMFGVNLVAYVFFFSTPRLRNVEEESSSGATLRMLCPESTVRTFNSQCVNGLICCGRAPWLVVCNPTTRQLVRLPKVKTRRNRIFSYFGYDPIEHQPKVLCMTISSSYGSGIAEEHQILTLGASKPLWRKIQCSIPHYPVTKGININGSLYYAAQAKRDEERAFSMIVSFDVRSESFSLVKPPEIMLPVLMNYKGKLACLCCKDGILRSTSHELWVLEDAEKSEWSKAVYAAPPSWGDLMECRPAFTGTTSAGEIVLAPCHISAPFYIYYYNLERGTVRSVEINGVPKGEFKRQMGWNDWYDPVATFPDHVENMVLL